MPRLVLPLLLLALVAPTAASAATPLQRSVSQLRTAVAKVKRHKPLKRRAAKVAKAVKRRKLCRARAASKAFRRAARRLPRKTRVRLTSAALTVEARLLTLPGTKRCGGAAVAPAPGAAPVTQVLASTPTELKLAVALPAVRLTPRQGGGRAFTQATMPGLSADSAPGTPGVPTMAHSFAIPQGATMTVTAQRSTGYTLDGVDLYPAQPSPVDIIDPDDPLFADKPFTQDKAAYASSQPIPSAPTAAAAQGDLRDLQLGQLAVAGAQYTPKAKKLEVFTSAVVDIRFAGGTGTFGDEQTASPYNVPFLKVYGNALVNGATVLGNLATPGPALICGEEMLIVTAPAYREAADRLAAARNRAGILTRVVETGTDPGDAGADPAAIRTFVQAAVADTGCIRPSYLLLLGSDDDIKAVRGGDAGQNIPSDFIYGEKVIGLPLPNLAVGRIPATSPAQALTAVDKIIGYEEAPPFALDFYANATITSYFEGAGPTDARGFVRSAEALRTGLIANGETVTRLYSKKQASDNPVNFDDGTPLPAGLSFAATNQDVVAEVNAGRFLFVSRDHGERTGVSAPAWGNADVAAMTNGALLPVFWLIVCSAGQLDPPGSLAEALVLRDGGGGVGAIAASRPSPTEPNNRLLAGLSDAVWPNILPGAGGPVAVRRMGDVLNAGKLHVILDAASIKDFYAATYTGKTNPIQDIRDEQRLYNYFGDPSMPLLTERPASASFSASLAAGAVKVDGLTAAPGGVVSLTEDGVPIGKAFVSPSGTAIFDTAKPIGDGALDVVIDTDGFAASKVHVRDHVLPEPKRPDLIVTAVSSQQEQSNVSVKSVSITVKNIGDGAAGGFTALVTGTGGPNQPPTSGVTLSFPYGLQPGKEATQTRTGTTLYNELTGTADSQEDVQESDETNNQATGQGPPYKP